MFLKIGHRGAKAYETENTLQSFQRAIELGANAIELDVRQTGDGALVVMHDDNLKRVYSKTTLVDQATLAELKEYSENQILALGEALRFIDKKVEKILVEIKEPGYEKKVLETIRKEHLSDRVILSSFHEEALAAIRALDEKIEIGLIYAKHKNPMASALKLQAQYLIGLYRFIHTKNVEQAHKDNLKVIAWTINTEEEVKAYKAKGVDGIASDRPDIL